MSPVAAVHTWWQAMQARDIATLAEIVLPGYLNSGGPGWLTSSRERFLAEARVFFSAGQITEWTLTDLVVSEYGNTAVCAYRWHETGSHGGTAFELSGVATDVLVGHDGIWRHLARHVSPDPGDSHG